MALQNLVLPILSVFRTAGLQQASGALRQLTAGFDSLGSKIGLAAGSFGAFSALTSARQFAIDSVNATAQFERNLLGLNQVFEDVTPQIRNFVMQVENYGLSQAQAAQASVFLGSVLKQYGFTTQESADQTERLVTLAQDLATTYGYDVQEALLAITALFRGEYDPIEKFGVAMKQSEVNARLAADGMGDLEGEQLALAQAQARLTMLFERADDAVGSFTRASDTLYASQRRLGAVIGNLQVAFGAPLQKPLAEINNIFADLAQQFGPQVVDIADSLGQALKAATPLIESFGEAFFLSIAPLQQVIDLLGTVIGLLSAIISPVIDATNTIGSVFVKAIDTSTSSLTRSSRAIDKYISDLLGLEDVSIPTPEEVGAPLALGTLFDDIIRHLDRLTYKNKVAMMEFYDDTEFAVNGIKRISAAQLEAMDSGADFEDALRKIATGSLDAEGKLDGLAGVFQRIDDAIAQSKAKQEMEDLGLSAAFIGEVLKKENWKEIFQNIATYAALAAIQVERITIPGRAGVETGSSNAIEKRRAEILKEINAMFNAGKKTGSTRKAAVATVADFFENMAEEVKKQSAREKLAIAGASAGLIDAILGSEVWEKLVNQIETGKKSLKDLQNQFDKTAAGIREKQAAYEEALKAQQQYDAEVKRINEALTEQLAQIAEQAEMVRQSFVDMLSTFSILPTIEREVGKFESQVVQMLASVEEALKNAFRNEDLLEAGYNELRSYAQKELAELQKIGEQRDELAKRFDLAKGLIDNYKKAFTAAASLTSLFGQLKDETEKRTVTEVTKGVVRLGNSLREFGVTVTRSFEEPVKLIQSKTAGLLGEFRTMAEKARGFADNLRKLRQLGLDPMLFNDLVEAGVVAGGETAQALVDGGADTISEINTLFGEINALGADLGEEVASTMYGTGLDLADGLLEGIRAKQNELEETARTMAEAFNKAFQEKINAGIEAARQAAEAVARSNAAAQIAELGDRPVLPEEDAVNAEAALRTINNRIAGLTKYIDATSKLNQKDEAMAKRDILEGLRDAISKGAPLDVSGFVGTQMRAEELRKAAVGAAQTVILNVQPGNRMQQNETVETLKQFINQNGQLLNFGIR